MRWAMAGLATVLGVSGCAAGPAVTVPAVGTAREVEDRVVNAFACWAYDEEFRLFWGYARNVADEGGRRRIEYYPAGDLFGRRSVDLTIEPRDGGMLVSGPFLSIESRRGRILGDLARWGAGATGCGPDHAPTGP